jgi:hypothetical protein
MAGVASITELYSQQLTGSQFDTQRRICKRVWGSGQIHFAQHHRVTLVRAEPIEDGADLNS